MVFNMITIMSVCLYVIPFRTYTSKFTVTVLLLRKVQIIAMWLDWRCRKSVHLYYVLIPSIIISHLMTLGCINCKYKYKRHFVTEWTHSLLQMDAEETDKNSPKNINPPPQKWNGDNCYFLIIHASLMFTKAYEEALSATTNVLSPTDPALTSIL